MSPDGDFTWPCEDEEIPLVEDEYDFDFIPEEVADWPLPDSFIDFGRNI